MLTRLDEDSIHYFCPITRARGAFEFTIPSNGYLENDTFTFVQKDGNGVSSAPAVSAVDLTPPPAPTFDPTGGAVITGQTEAGARVELFVNGVPIGISAPADANGRFTFTPATPIPVGTTVLGTAIDVAGNKSLAQESTEVVALPSAPAITSPLDGAILVTDKKVSRQTLSGTAEAGTTTGNTISVTVDTVGVVPASPNNGKVVTGVAPSAQP